MHSHGILLPRAVSAPELQSFVEAEGGHWQPGPPLAQGYFSEGPRADLFIRAWEVDRNLATYTAEELAEAEQACGLPIVGHLSIDRSRGPDGRKLARRIIAKVIERWGGFEIDGG